MLMNNNLYVYSCGKDAARQPVDHGGSDASLPVDGGDRHGGLHPLSEEQGHLQNWCLQDLQDPLQGKTVKLSHLTLSLSPAFVSCLILYTHFQHLFFFLLSSSCSSFFFYY